MSKMHLSVNTNSLKSNKYWLNVLGLHFFQLDTVKWKEFHHYIIDELWAELNIEPHMGLGYGGPFKFSDRSITYKGLKRKLEKLDYQGLTHLDFAHLIPEEIANKAVNEHLAQAAIYSGLNEKYNNNYSLYLSNITFILDDKIKPFNFEYYTKVANKLHELSGAVYGYYFYHPQKCGAAIFVSGDDHVSTTMEEYNRNTKWRSARIRLKDDIVNYLRDIFRINFLSPHHLELVVDNAGTKLGDWINKGTESSRGVLRQLSKDFYYWYVEDADLQVEIRNQLAPSGHIICVEDKKPQINISYKLI